MTILLSIPLITLALIAIFLIEAEDYEDGVFGRFCLLFMLGSCLLSLTFLFVEEHKLNPYLVVALLWAFAAFMLRHVYKFLRWKYSGKFAWTKKVDPNITQH